MNTSQTQASRMHPDEWALRVDLAACYRLVALYGWSDLVFTHISAKLPATVSGEDHQFLINPYGLMFDEITASSLVKVDMQCNKLDAENPHPVNPAGFVIHSAVHEARHDANCVLHTHTRAGVAVSAQKEGVLPISQQSTFVLASLAYHAYEGVAIRDDEKLRLQKDLGDANYLMLRNHGLLTTGRSVPEAFLRLYRLERACQIQLDAAAAGTLNVLGDNLAAKSGADMDRFSEMESAVGIGDLEFAALVRKLDKVDAGWRH